LVSKKQTVLMILDGYGLSDNIDGNAIRVANTPNIDALMEKYPWQKGKASGLSVGLPDGQMGNSEVGHVNIGAGRIVYQELTRITKSIEDGDFFLNKELLDAIENCKSYGSSLHIAGLVSNGGVHSHIDHLLALLKLAKDNGLTKVYVHAFLDGRDTAPKSGKIFIKELEEYMQKIGVGKIASLSGRFYALDRDNRWERVKQAYEAMVLGIGEQATSTYQCLQDSYEKDVSDEFVLPTVIMDNDMPTASIKENDSFIMFNFRPDRAREITRAICDPSFNEFERGRGYFKTKNVCFTEYDITIPNKEIAFKPQSLNNTLGGYISSLGLNQLRVAETEKYAHVTFFFNGGIEKEHTNEDRVLIPSPKVATYDLQPEMNASLVSDAVIKAIKELKYDLIVVNYANADMVGHTGKMPAAVKAIEALDKEVGRVIEVLTEVNAQMFICSDHGNADKMLDPDSNEVFTAHSINPVPFILVNCQGVKGLKDEANLSDVAPTILDMMGIKKPVEMTGESLLIKD
jgi:2,3-bisphosphoglycerate-independent phosphoglycerate mutase